MVFSEDSTTGTKKLNVWQPFKNQKLSSTKHAVFLQQRRSVSAKKHLQQYTSN